MDMPALIEDDRKRRILGMADLFSRAAIQPTAAGDLRTSAAVGAAVQLLADDFVEDLASSLGLVNPATDRELK